MHTWSSWSDGINVDLPVCHVNSASVIRCTKPQMVRIGKRCCVETWNFHNAHLQTRSTFPCYTSAKHITFKYYQNYTPLSCCCTSLSLWHTGILFYTLGLCAASCGYNLTASGTEPKYEQLATVSGDIAMKWLLSGMFPGEKVEVNFIVIVLYDNCPCMFCLQTWNLTFWRNCSRIMDSRISFSASQRSCSWRR